MSVKETLGSIVVTLLRVVGALLLVGLVLFGGLFIWAGFAMDLGYLEIGETTLDESGTDYDYQMDLLVIDQLTAYEEEYDDYYLATDYYLGAFLDGDGAVNLCIFEVQSYDDCFDRLRGYMEDDSQQIGDCWVSGIYTFLDGDDERYGEELSLKEAWVSDYGDALAEQGTLFGVSGILPVKDTDYVIYIWTDEEEYLDGMKEVYGFAKGLGVVMVVVGLVGLVLLLRPKKKHAPKMNGPQGEQVYNPESGAWEPRSAPPEEPQTSAPAGNAWEARTYDPKEARTYDPNAWQDTTGRSPWPEERKRHDPEQTGQEEREFKTTDEL